MMKTIGTTLWIIPAAAHIAYVLATHDTLPATIGATESNHGTDINFFIIEWFAVFGFANAIFAGIHIKLPKMSTKMLSVPQKNYWLSTDELKEVVIDKLRGICETSLLTFNIFFLAVYQAIYQSNVSNPMITIPPLVLIGGFMIVPLLIAIGNIAFSMLFFAKKSKQAH